MSRLIAALGIVIFVSYLAFIVDLVRGITEFNHVLVEYILQTRGDK